MTEKCKIPFQWTICSDSKKLKWRDLTGPEKIRLFEAIDIPCLFPDVPHGVVIQKLWMDFKALVDKMAESSTDPLLFKSEVHSWLALYLSIYQTKNITPYIHAFVKHVWEFLDLYGSLEQFSQQGLEKLNDLTTSHYFSSNNHHHKEEEALRQLLLKWNRIERMEDAGVARHKRKCTCSICGISGHNKRACKENSVPI